MDLKKNSDDWNRWKLLLKSVSFFAGLKDNELDLLLQHGEVKKYTMYEYIAREDAHTSNIYVILKGKVSITKDREYDRKKQHLDTLSDGDCIGEMASLLDGKRTANIIAVLDTYLYSIVSENIEKLEQTTQTILYKRMATSLAKRLKKASELIVKQ